MYNYNFALGSVFFMSLTLFFYLRQNRIHDLQDSLYTLMLISGLTAVLFDFIAAAVEPYAATQPLWLLYALNLIFLLSEQICLPAFFMYAVSVAGRYHRLHGALHILPLLPFFVVLTLLIISPLSTAGIFYIDSLHVYQPGATHWVLYTVCGFYMLASCILLIFNYKSIALEKRVFIVIFVVLILCAAAVQIYNPSLLLTTSVTALALTAMYYTLRSSGEQEDPFTGALCRSVLPELLKDLNEKKRPFTLLLYTVLNSDELMRSYGVSHTDALMAELADWLKTAYPSEHVVFMNDGEFTLVIEGELEADELQRRRHCAPDSLAVEGSELPVKLAMASLYCPSGDKLEQSLTAMDYLFRKMRAEQRESVFMADDDFRSRCGRLSKLEGSLDRIAEKCIPLLVTEEVLSLSESMSRPAMVDISLGMLHSEFSGISPEELLLAVKKSGNLRWYYDTLIKLTADWCREQGQNLRLCIPLLPAVLIQEGMSKKLHELVTGSGMAPGDIVLRLFEEDAAVELPLVRDSIRSLADYGFGFRLDGFAEGYTDVSLLGELPVDFVKLDKSLLKRAVADQRAQALLMSVLSILRDIGKLVVCDGVDSFEEARCAIEAGAELYCGEWAEA